jgi:DNA-binding NarL/FixJ family response regulator
MKFELSAAEIDELKSAHRETRERRFAYRINAVILLGSGWTASEVAEALLLDADTVRNYFQTYQDGGVDALSTTHCIITLQHR